MKIKLKKQYTVEFLDWYGGECHNFWLKDNALKFIKQHRKEWLWIDLINNWTKEEKRIKSTDTSKYCRDENGNYNLYKQI